MFMSVKFKKKHLSYYDQGKFYFDGVEIHYTQTQMRQCSTITIYVHYICSTFTMDHNPLWTMEHGTHIGWLNTWTVYLTTYPINHYLQSFLTSWNHLLLVVLWVSSLFTIKPNLLEISFSHLFLTAGFWMIESGRL